MSRSPLGLVAGMALALTSSFSPDEARDQLKPRRRERSSGHLVGRDPSMRYDWTHEQTRRQSADPRRRRAKKSRNRGANASRGKTYRQLFGGGR